MSSEKFDNARDEVDSWQELAKELLGVELTEELDDDVVLPDEDVELLDFELEEESTSPADARDDSPDETVSPDIERESVVSDSDEPTAELVDESESVGETEQPEVVSDQQKADDLYWDALEDWTWEDEDDRPQSPVPPATEDTSETIETPDDAGIPASVTTEPVRSRSDAYLDAPSFGIGVLDDDSPAPGPQADVAAESTDATPVVTESVDEPADAVAVCESAATGDVLAPVSDEVRPPDEAAKNVSDGTDTAEAARVEDASATPSGGKRRRRRRKRKPRASEKETGAKTDEEVEVEAVAEGTSEQTEVPKKRVRRRRRPREKEAPQPETLADEEASDTVEPVGDTSKPADSKPTAPRTPAKYRDVPTWEEAISYLLEPSRVGAVSPKKSTSANDS